MLNIFDDERETKKAGRNILNDGDYLEYKALFGKFIRLRDFCLRRNQPIKLRDGTLVIPRIQQQIDAKPNPTNLKELIDYQVFYISMWEQMDQVIEAISKNEYVLRRMHLDPKKDVESKSVRDSMYSLIRP